MIWLLTLFIPQGPNIMMIGPNVLVPYLSKSKPCHEGNDASHMCGKEYSHVC